MDLTREIRHRRDVCFSQALTALTSALMAKFWATGGGDAATFVAACADPAVGPLASFEGLLSMYGKNFSMFNDMIVAVEDLRNVEFSVVVVDHGLLKRTSHGGAPSSSGRQVNHGFYFNMALLAFREG